MVSRFPVAEGVRLSWLDLPEQIRREIETKLGSAVVEATSQPGGFSPGLASKVVTADGQRVFIKAISSEQNPRSPDMHRREASIVGSLPSAAPVPRLRWTLDQGPPGWVVLAFDHIEGRQPHVPWVADELARVLGALDDLARSLTPSPIEVETAADLFRADFLGWRRLAESGSLDGWTFRHIQRLIALEQEAPQAVEGGTLLHLDIRADNVLLAGDRVWFVDWPWARVGAGWLDAIGLAPSVAMQGGPHPEELFESLAVARDADPDAVTAAIGAIAGYFVYEASLPPAPGLPTVRAFQAAQGEAAVNWLRSRTGWK